MLLVLELLRLWWLEFPRVERCECLRLLLIGWMGRVPWHVVGVIKSIAWNKIRGLKYPGLQLIDRIAIVAIYDGMHSPSCEVTSW